MSLVIQEPHRYNAKHRHDELEPVKSNPEESKSDPARVRVHPAVQLGMHPRAAVVWLKIPQKSVHDCVHLPTFHRLLNTYDGQ